MFDIGFIVAGAITGFTVGLTGVGGGALMTPILLLFFGINPTVAIATDLWFATITKLVGARIHSVNGHVDWQVIYRMWLGSLPTAIVIVLLVAIGFSIEQVNWLQSLIATVILITALGLIAAPKLNTLAKNRRIAQPARFKSIQPMLTVFCGILLGGLVTLTSVGAGALGTVMILYLYPLRMIDPHRLIATDLVHAVPLAATAGIGYLFAGFVEWGMLFNLLLGSLPAVILSSQLVNKLSSKVTRTILAVVLIGLSIGMFI